MASTTLAVASALRLGIAGDTSAAGADTVYGFNGTDMLAAGGQRAPGGDRFLDDAGGAFDAALGYALAFQHLLAEAWKGEASIVLRYLDQGGSCAPLTEAERALAASRAVPDGGTAANDPAIDHVASEAIGDGPTGGDGGADYADATASGADLFGMS
jgi:hypothetical protein